MFLQLHENASTIPALSLNLALVSADMGQYMNAVTLVSLTSRRQSVLCLFHILNKIADYRAPLIVVHEIVC